VLGDASPIGQAPEPSGGMAIGDVLEIAGLVVAIVVGFPAVVVAVTTIKSYLGSRQSVAGKPEIYMRHKRPRCLPRNRGQGLPVTAASKLVALYPKQLYGLYIICYDVRTWLTIHGSSDRGLLSLATKTDDRNNP
jgi:hypothetical protein